MSKLKKEELLKWSRKFYGLWNQGLNSDADIERANQAYQQIREMIQKPEVTEDWIEEKAIELNNEILLANYKESYYNMSKDFIRSLLEQVVGK